MCVYIALAKIIRTLGIFCIVGLEFLAVYNISNRRLKERNLVETDFLGRNPSFSCTDYLLCIYFVLNDRSRHLYFSWLLTCPLVLDTHFGMLSVAALYCRMETTL